MGNLDEVMKKIRKNQTVTEDIDELEKPSPKEEVEEKKVEQVDDDLENDDEDIEEAEIPEDEISGYNKDTPNEFEEVVKPAQNDKKVIKSAELQGKTTAQKPTEEELHQQKIREIAILQDAGVFRSEILIQLAKINENLYALNYLIDKAVGGDDEKAKK